MICRSVSTSSIERKIDRWQMTTTHRPSKVALRNAVGTERDYLYKVFRAAVKE